MKNGFKVIGACGLADKQLKLIHPK